MKLTLLTAILLCIISFGSVAQVTQINSNKSLEVVYSFSLTKTLLFSSLDNSIWVTDGTLAGTVQLSTTIFYLFKKQNVKGMVRFNEICPKKY